MGSSASTLSKDQSIDLTKDLREHYERYKSQGLSDADIHQKLIADYDKKVGQIHTPTSKAKAEAGAHQLGKNPSKSGLSSRRIPLGEGASGKHARVGTAGGPGGGGTSKTPTRRRSFDTNAANRKPVPPPVVDATVKATPNSSAKVGNSESTENTVKSAQSVQAIAGEHPPLSGVASDAALQSAQIVVDSWDSVTTQPFCNLCQMAFKSEAFLQRHVKFSDLHIQNVKKQQQANNEGVAAAEVVVAPAPTVSTPLLVTPQDPKPKENPLQDGLLVAVANQIEGLHFKMLYTGSKFFWRTQDNVDLHFFHHILPDVIEIVSYDCVRGKEMNRIYLDYGCVWDNARHNYHKNTRDANPIVEEESKRQILTTYILQRLQLSTISNQIAAITDHDTPVGSTGMCFAKLSGDEKDRSPVLEKPPIVLVPVVVTRRRRTNAEEIEATISSLADDRKALSEATGMAERIANLVYSSANQIASKKWWTDFNRPRKLWVWAIRRVIRQKLVAETKKILLARAAAKEKEGLK
eukprot:gene10255-11350_t